MAFSVTPTSGAGPYVFTAEFTNKESLFSNQYQLEVRPRTGEGSCPAPATSGQRASGAEANLLNSSSYTSVATIPEGSCMTSTVVIRDLDTGTVISQETAQIDNLE